MIVFVASTVYVSSTSVFAVSSVCCVCVCCVRVCMCLYLLDRLLRDLAVCRALFVFVFALCLHVFVRCVGGKVLLNH